MGQSYDIDKFVMQVRDLLCEAGMEIQIQDDPRPDVAAGMLLRSLGLVPVMDQVEALRRSTDHPWPDRDDELAARTRMRRDGSKNW